MCVAMVQTCPNHAGIAQLLQDARVLPLTRELRRGSVPAAVARTDQHPVEAGPYPERAIGEDLAVGRNDRAGVALEQVVHRRMLSCKIERQRPAKEQVKTIA